MNNYRREHWLSNNGTNPRENALHNEANRLSGNDWNMYVKDIILHDLREDSLAEQIDSMTMTQVFNLIPVVQMGMFDTAVRLLDDMIENITNEKSAKWLRKWQNAFIEADGISK